MAGREERRKSVDKADTHNGYDNLDNDHSDWSEIQLLHQIRNEVYQAIQIDRQQEEMKRKKKKRKQAVLLLLLLLLLGAVGGILYRYLGVQKNDRIQRELNSEVGILPGMSEEEVLDRLNRSVEEGRLNISINPTPEYENGMAEGNIRIENIPGNRYCFTVTVKCIGASEDPGAQDHVDEIVMQTGLIEPGSYVERKKLDVNLPKGQYTCVATFDAYELITDAESGEEDYKAVGAVGTQILITVKE